MSENPGVDLSGLHREIDRLKSQLCRCQHQGECLACQGFEVLRQQAQMVVSAASQPVLMQVAQEAAVKDLLGQMGGAQEKLMGDPRLVDLLSQVMERVQEDLGGPEALQRMFGGFPGFPGFPGQEPGGDGAGPEPDPSRLPPDDRPPRPRPRSED
ncbi:MAG TPA: hypothetical protein VGQ42_07555 [Candidatus Dormibacteraeota bacterium]|jgi:hypothetical protein|nr:hypothetical protein [Candidatus Dormibacteraeota bacterium]